MSRTYRKKYVPIRSKESMEMIEEDKENALCYIRTGRDLMGLRWYSTNYRLKAGLAFIRFDKNITRDGTKAHADLSVMLELAVKKIDSGVRRKMRHELNRMKSGALDWDENIQNVNKIRAHERGLCWYDI